MRQQKANAIRQPLPLNGAQYKMCSISVRNAGHTFYYTTDNAAHNTHNGACVCVCISQETKPSGTMENDGWTASMVKVGR